MAKPNTEENGLLKSIEALLESGRGADVTLVVGGSELPAHSFILAVRSPVFAAMLQHDTQEARTRRIEIADVEEAVLKQLLYFMYTDTAAQMESMAAELLSAADKYDLPLLKKRCEQVLARDLTVDNAVATVLLAEMHSCQLLKSAAVYFIASRPQVMATEGWINILRGNVEAAEQISKQVAAATPSSKYRNLSEEHKKDLMKRLFQAARDGSVREIWALLDSGAPIDAKDGIGNTALHLAVQNNRAAAVKLLIDAGADVNVRDSYQRTPLHSAASINDMGIMLMILAASACIDAQDKQGNTPLHRAACSTCDADKVKALLVAGAKRDIKNTAGDLANNYRVDGTIRALFNTY